MKSDYNLTLKGLTLPAISDCTYDVSFGVTVEHASIQRKEVGFVIDWMEYWDGSTIFSDSSSNKKRWKHADATMLDMIHLKYLDEISKILLALIEISEYNDAEENPYPDW